MPRAIHIQTQVSIVIGVADDDGNIVAHDTMQLRMQKHTNEAFEDVRRLVEERKTQCLQAFLAEQPEITEQQPEPIPSEQG